MAKYDIVGKSRWFFTFSIAITIIGLIFFLVNGLKYDVQFSGGTEVKVEMADDKFEPNKAVDLVKKLFNKRSVAYKLKGYDPKKKDNNSSLLKIQISSTEGTLTEAQLGKLIKELKTNKSFNIKKDASIEQTNINPAMGTEARNKGFLAVIVSALMITLYLAVRFKLMSGMVAGVTAVIALLHDVFIMMTVYTIFNIPIDETFIAAILTIIGFSINDTIIIYDRIRENMKKIRKTDIKDLVNLSIIQTLGRSINTVVTVLICALSVYVFAVIYNIDSMKNFSFPLIIGVISGAYSSICIASPLWVVWMNRKEKNKAIKRNLKRA